MYCLYFSSRITKLKQKRKRNIDVPVVYFILGNIAQNSNKSRKQRGRKVDLRPLCFLWERYNKSFVGRNLIVVFVLDIVRFEGDSLLTRPNSSKFYILPKKAMKLTPRPFPL